MSFDQSKTIGTSLKQVPAQVKIINWDNHKGADVLDYGAGKYPELVQEYLKSQGIKWIESFDPYNSNISKHAEGMFDVVINSNVLNVLSSDVMLHDVVFDIANHMHDDSVAYIQIYLGDKSGKAGETTRGWQRNAPIKDYLPVLNKYFYDIKAVGNRFVCRKPVL